MPIFSDLIYARSIPQHVPLPLGQIEQTAAALQEKFDLNKDAADRLLGQIGSVKVRDINRPVVDQVIGTANQRLDKIAEAGDFENAGPEVKKIAREIQGNQILQGAIRDKAAYDAWLAGLDARSKDVHDPQRLSDARAYSEAINNRPVELDATGNPTNIFSGYTPVATPDISKDVLSFMDKLKSSNSPLEVGKSKDGKPIYMTKINNSYYVTGQKKEMTEQEAARSIAQFMTTDPTISAYFSEGYMLDRFKTKYDPVTRQYRTITPEDFGGQKVFDGAAAAAGLDPKELAANPRKMDEIYQAYFLQKEIGKATLPFAQAASFDDLELKYHQDFEFLNRQRSDLALNNTLRGIQARTAAQKELVDYNYLKKAEEQKRQTSLVTMGVIPTEPAINYATAKETSEIVRADLERLQQKENMAAEKGSSVTFTPQELSQKIQLQNKLRALDAEQKMYMQAVAITPEGLQVIDDQWRAYEKASGGNPTISKNDFYNFAKRGEYANPRQVRKQQQERRGPGFLASATGGSVLVMEDVNDPKDYRTYLKVAEKKLSTEARVMQAANEQSKALDQQGYFGFYGGSTGGKETDFVNNPKKQSIDRVSQALTRQVFANGGVGYGVIGTGENLDTVLRNAQITMTGDDAKYKGRNVNAQVVPLTNVGKDVMYQMVFTDPKTGEMVKSFRIMPENQAFHADLMRNLNGDLAENYAGDTEIGRNARIAVAHYDLPMFNLEQDSKIIDSEIGEKTQEGVISVGNLNPTQNGNWIVVKQNATVPKSFVNGNPVGVKQPQYHLVRLQDNIPADVVVSSKNIKEYLFDPTGGVADNALLNKKRSTEALGEEQAYAKKNSTYATGFSSAEDALINFYTDVHKGQFKN